MLEMSLHRVANSVAGQGTTLLRVQLEVLGEAFFRELGLRQTPTLFLFRDGDERTRLAGFQSPQQIEAAIALHFVEPSPCSAAVRAVSDESSMARL